MAAQELVGRGELGADARRLAARPLDGALGLHQPLARRSGLAVGSLALGERGRHLLGRLLLARALSGECLLEL